MTHNLIKSKIFSFRYHDHGVVDYVQPDDGTDKPFRNVCSQPKNVAA
jgi:hypothetical protein